MRHTKPVDKMEKEEKNQAFLYRYISDTPERVETLSFFVAAATAAVIVVVLSSLLFLPGCVVAKFVFEILLICAFVTIGLL